MRTGRLILAVAILLALAGCAPAGQQAASSPTARATPVFASDAEALAAAEKAYAAYLKVSDQIANDGGKNPEKVSEYVTADRLQSELAGSELYRSRGIRTVGLTRISNTRLEQVTSVGTSTSVTISLCWDASSVQVIDSSGTNVTPEDRVDRQTLEVHFVTAQSRSTLVLESDEPWSGHSFC